MKQPTQPTKRKPGRPKLEQSETKINILRTASYLFMEIGYDKVSLELVAQKCGITKASVYYYFSNKSTLFTECLSYVMHIAYTATISILQKPIPLKERLTEIAFKQMSNAHLDFETMMRDAAKDLSEEQIQQIRDAEGKLEQALIEAFEQAIERGEINAVHQPLLLAHLFTAILTMKNHLKLKALPLQEMVEQTIHIFWEGAMQKSASKP
ncbi:TetR/AcrR family transcriptional regulator [Paenibacillus septentrionalis]|uniref:TetR/AcrR family transcriptional regulator n=1 Tax=Paenibacillus septentrionalis TaxID=429342 RepID=A0ABW1UZZ8_9BACL